LRRQIRDKALLSLLHIAKSVAVEHGKPGENPGRRASGLTLYEVGAAGLPKVPAAIGRHHLLPRQFKSLFESAGLNIESITVNLSQQFDKAIHEEGGGKAREISWNKVCQKFRDHAQSAYPMKFDMPE
jgi:hypothetical protein